MATQKETSPSLEEKLENLDATVQKWIEEKLANSAFSANTEAWGRMLEAKADLVRRIAQSLKS